MQQKEEKRDRDREESENKRWHKERKQNKKYYETLVIIGYYIRTVTMMGGEKKSAVWLRFLPPTVTGQTAVSPIVPNHPEPDFCN